MTSHRLAGLAAALLLSACGDPSGISMTNASIAEVAEKAKTTQQQQPGQWETTSEMVSIDLGPTAGPMADMMRQQVGKKRVDSTCITPEQAKRPAFGASDPVPGAECRFDKFAMGGGKLDAVMRCAMRGTAMVVTQDGSYSATAYDLKSSVARTDESGKPGGGVTMRIVGKRTGDCKTATGGKAI